MQKRRVSSSLFTAFAFTIGLVGFVGQAAGGCIPTLVSIWPRSGPASGGTSIDLFGNDCLENAAWIEFGEVRTQPREIQDCNWISVTTPPHAAGWVDLKLITLTGESSVLEHAFYYIPPVVISEQVFEIAEGTAVGATVGTIKVTGGTDWRWFDASSSEFKVDSHSGTITVAGKLDHETTPTCYLNVSVMSESSSDAAVIAIKILDLLEVTTMTPAFGPMAGAQRVTIAGNDFERAAVTFGGVSATVVATTPGSLTVTTPPHEAGRVDVVVTAPDGSAKTLPDRYQYLAPGCAEFGPSESQTDAKAIAAGDFNGDGKQDLAVRGDRAVRILLGDGHGGYSYRGSANVEYPSIAPPAVVDFDHDGKQDLVVGASGIHVLRGDGTGGFALLKRYGEGPVDSFAVADFNGDGNVDFAAPISSFDGISWSSKVFVFIGNGDGTFSDPPQVCYPGRVRSMAVADFNGDGNQDLALAADLYPRVDSAVVILLGDGKGSFGPPSTYPFDSYALQVTVGEFNGDGSPDLTVVTNEPALLIFLGRGDGTLAKVAEYSAGLTRAYVGAVAIGDFDGDGRQDLVIGNYCNDPRCSGTSIMVGNGDGTFGAAEPLVTTGNASFVAAADINCDNRHDVVYSDGWTMNVSLQLPNPSCMRIRAIAPVAGPIEGGQTAAISGVGLDLPTSVRFGETNAAIMSSSHTSITVITPAHAAGSVDAAVESRGQAKSVRYTYSIPITGGGWIDSPAGAYEPWRSLAGKANFAFTAKYDGGAALPKGQTEFNFADGSFRFRSTSYESLVTVGSRAQLRGTGTATNWGGGIAFSITAAAGQSGGKRDQLRIRIWDPLNHYVLYDNLSGAPDDLNTALPPIGGGSIVVH